MAKHLRRGSGSPEREKHLYNGPGSGKAKMDIERRYPSNPDAYGEIVGKVKRERKHKKKM